MASKKIKGKRVEESKTVMTELIMPNDTNPLGNLMGGYLMRWMDICGAICAAKHAENHVVTASVDNVSFRSPIKLGEVITLEAVVTRAFTTSIEVYVEVYANSIDGSGARMCNHAYLTFVALNPKSLKPQPVLPVLPITPEEINRYDGASRRREIRLVQSGRLKPSEAVEVKEYLNKA
jgi:acyl-CoA hydrolase